MSTLFLSPKKLIQSRYRKNEPKNKNVENLTVSEISKIVYQKFPSWEDFIKQPHIVETIDNNKTIFDQKFQFLLKGYMEGKLTNKMLDLLHFLIFKYCKGEFDAHKTSKSIFQSPKPHSRISPIQSESVTQSKLYMQLKRERESLLRECGRYERALNENKTLQERFEKQMKQLQKQNSRLSMQNTKLLDELRESTNSISTIKHESVMKELENEKRIKDAQNKSLSLEIQMKKRENSMLNESLLEVDEKEEEITSLRAEKIHLQKKLNDTMDRIEIREEEITSLAKMKRDLQMDINSTLVIKNELIKDLNRNVKNLKARNADLKALLNNELIKNENLQNELHNERQRSKIMEEKILSENETLRGKNEALEMVVKEVKLNEKELQNERKKYNKQLNKYNDLIKKLKDYENI